MSDHTTTPESGGGTAAARAIRRVARRSVARAARRDTAPVPEPLEPLAARLRRPGWRDPRLLVGVALVAASVALGSWALRAAAHTVPVYVAREVLVPGAAIEPAALSVAQVRLTGADLGRYVRADEPLARGAVVERVVGVGELLPAAAVGTADELALRPVSVPVTGQVPDAVHPGGRVDLWFAPESGAAPGQGAASGPAAAAGAVPSQLAAALVVTEVDRPQGALVAGGTTTVCVLVPVAQLSDVLAALAADGHVDVVAVPGT